MCSETRTDRSQKTDFTSLFNWNTKQVFIYLLATYPSSSSNSSPDKTPMSQAIIWDKIITAPESPFSWESMTSKAKTTTTKKSGSSKKASKAAAAASSKAAAAEVPGKLSLKNQKPKYQITDITGRIAERGNATLEVGWNVQPWVGALQWTSWGKSGASQGRSRAFEFPPLKGAKVQTTMSEAQAQGGEASPVV